MDYLNPKNRRNHLIRLFTGYVLISITVVLAVMILFYLVLGFSYKDGVVIQNGMMFISSSPTGANITINGKAEGAANKRLIVPAGKYQIELQRDGYRPWQRTVNLEGSKVQRYYYPILIPNQLTSSSVVTVKGTVDLATESPDSNWLLLNNPASPLKFKLADLSNPLQIEVTNLTLPSALVSSGDRQSWQLVEWSNDSRHVLLRHNFDSSHEFVVVDVEDPTKSVNINDKFGASPTRVNLFDENYDEYWFYNDRNKELSRADLSGGKISRFLPKVLAYKSFSDSIVLYATAAKSGKVKIIWHQDNRDYVIADDMPLSKAADGYLFDLAQFEGDWYVAIGETGGKSISIYKNPVDYITSHKSIVQADYALDIKHPNYLKFSANAQFILAENGLSVAVFNALYATNYEYELGRLDAPQKHVIWMDGFHLLHVANGQLEIADFNGINRQVLVAASAKYQPFFNTNQEYLFTLSNSGSGDKATTILSSTPLRLPADL